MINAADLFPSETDRKFIKHWLDEWQGTLTKVWDENGNLIYENNS
jgi:hypothetical protein